MRLVDLHLIEVVVEVLEGKIVGDTEEDGLDWGWANDRGEGVAGDCTVGVEDYNGLGGEEGGGVGNAGFAVEVDQHEGVLL